MTRESTKPPTIWERITDWLMRDMYTAEERMLMRVEAERLALRTELQRARIEARRKPMLVATWVMSYVSTKDADTPFAQDRQSEAVWLLLEDCYGSRSMKFSAATIAGVPANESKTLLPLAKSYSVYIAAVAPWLDGVADDCILLNRKGIVLHRSQAHVA